MRLIIWTLKALVFFTLFAFALNNQHPASVKWFFGVEWQAPMVFVVLAAFAAGCAMGVVAMVPGRWKRGRKVVTTGRRSADQTVAAGPQPAPPLEAEPNFPPRDGL